MKYSEKNINKYIIKFETGLLTKDEWNHHAHVLMCLYYLNEFEYYEAVIKIKTGIIHLNKAIGIKNTLESGYHETLTLFWIWVIHAFLNFSKNPEESISEKINRLLESPYSKKYLPFFFYSEDLLFSPKARITWVEPDLNNLDRRLITEKYPQSIWYG